MSLGVILKGMNYRFQKKRVDFWFEFVPQIVMLLALFGFMDLLIIVKWTTDFTLPVTDPEQARLKPPSIVSTMIAMVLGFGEQSDPKLKERDLIPYQSAIMRCLLVIIMICVPTMLFVKPYHEYKKMQTHHNEEEEEVNRESVRVVNSNQVYHAINADTYEDVDLRSTLPAAPLKTKKHQSGHSMGDIFIHQLIETIEFVLGTVSNTASYLRLWALSLAHSQLAKVFFENTIKGGIQSGSFLSLFFGYFIFITFTIGVLLLMDLMEAFLHTLRLHWVEFQNKFYKGGGVKFTPYSIEKVLLEVQERAVSQAEARKQRQLKAFMRQQ